MMHEHKGIHDFEKTFYREIEKIKETNMADCNKEVLLQFKDYLLSENIGYAKIANGFCIKPLSQT